MQDDDAAIGEKLGKPKSAGEEIDEAQQERYDAWNEAMSGSDVPTFDDSSTWIEGYFEGAKTQHTEKNPVDYTEHMRRVIDESWDTENAGKSLPDTEEKNDLRNDTKKENEDEIEDAELDLEFLDQKKETASAHETQTAAHTEELGQAGQMAGFGIDTAARLYGLEAVVTEIQRTDETGRDAENPVGAIYERLAPSSDARRHLFTEIHKDSVYPSKYTTGIDENEPTKRVGLDVRNHFYEKTSNENSDWQWRRPDGNVTQGAVDAIGATKKLLEAIEEGENFTTLRKRGSEQGKTPFEYLLHNNTNLTFSRFIDRIGMNLDGDTEVVIEELEKQEEENKSAKLKDEEFLQEVKKLIANETPEELFEYIENFDAKIKQETADEVLDMLVEAHTNLDVQIIEKMETELAKIVGENPAE